MAKKDQDGPADGEAVTAVVEPVKPDSKRVATTYIALKREDGTPGWVEHGNFDAMTGKGQALKKYVEGLAEEERVGTWKAVAVSAFEGGFTAGVRTEVVTDFSEIA